MRAFRQLYVIKIGFGCREAATLASWFVDGLVLIGLTAIGADLSLVCLSFGSLAREEKKGGSFCISLFNFVRFVWFLWSVV